MGKIMVLNGSPRAPKSNSKGYIQLFQKHFKGSVDSFNITKTNHKELCEKMSQYSDVLFVFPLYADGLPVTLLNFLKSLEDNLPANKPTISIIVNCGFIEWQQNNVAIKIMKLFAKENGFKVGSTLSIGGGEAILNTPFKLIVDLKMKKLAKAIFSCEHKNLAVTMPLSKKMYIAASTKYWIRYGERNGITEEQMRTNEIE